MYMLLDMCMWMSFNIYKCQIKFSITMAECVSVCLEGIVMYIYILLDRFIKRHYGNSGSWNDLVQIKKKIGSFNENLIYFFRKIVKEKVKLI